MAKATLTYNISDPEDSQDFKRAVKSLDMAMALWDIVHLKKKLEYRFENQDNSDNDVFDGIEAMAEGISNILDEHNLVIDELIN